MHTTRLEISFELFQLGLENKADIILEQKAPRKSHYTKLEISFKLIVENKVDTVLNQYSRFIYYPFDNYVHTELSQHALESTFIDINLNQFDIADSLIDVELKQEAIGFNLVDLQLRQPREAENLVDIRLEQYLPGYTNKAEVEVEQSVEFDNLVDIDVEHWVQFDNLPELLIAQYTTDNNNLVEVELVKRSGISNFAEVHLIQFHRNYANVADLWINQHTQDEALAEISLNQAAYAESLVDTTFFVYVITDNLADLILDKTTKASNRVEIWLVAGAHWNFASLEAVQIVKIINLADTELLQKFFFETYKPGDSPWGGFTEWDSAFSWKGVSDGDDDWGWS